MACRNRRWPIQRRSSTSSRCMTAICPAGPPKVCSETRNQARTASRKGGTAVAWTGAACGVGSDIGSPSGSGRLAAEQQAAADVLVQAVEERAGDGEGALVVAGHRQAAQQHVEARGLGGVEAAVVEVGLVHDLADPLEHGVVEAVHAQDRLERAVVA